MVSVLMIVSRDQMPGSPAPPAMWTLHEIISHLQGSSPPPLPGHWPQALTVHMSDHNQRQGPGVSDTKISEFHHQLLFVPFLNPDHSGPDKRKYKGAIKSLIAC